MKKQKTNLEKEIEKTQRLVNYYIRLKCAKITPDGLVGICYTCGKIMLLLGDNKKHYHAGHYWKADKKSGHQSVRFHFDNIRPQCSGCNTYRGGMMAEFAQKLIEEIGIDRFNKLGIMAKMPKKFNFTELEQIRLVVSELLLEDEMQEKIKLYHNK